MNNTTGDFNTANGHRALRNNTTADYNTAIGWNALSDNITGTFNTASGAGALLANTANENTATGAGALFPNSTGAANTADGAFALFSNTTGSGNTAIGDQALLTSTTPCCNTAIGRQSLFHNTTGEANTAIGQQALFSNTTGSSNTALGNLAGGNVTTANGIICIGENVAGANVNDTCFIGNIRGTTTQNNNAIPVLIDSAGQLGTTSSSRRYKTDIKPMDKASESILALKPVSFRYKIHKDMTPQFGLIAEQVAEINPNLVIYDADGKPYTVRYDQVNAMLLNEFLKEHKTVQEQGATIARMQKEIETLTAGLEKVSAQLELSKPAPQTASNNPDKHPSRLK